jgi:hypothetical protein
MNNTEGNFLSFGSLDLSFKLYLNKEDLVSNNVTWKSINSLKDLKFLTQNQNLWKRIDLFSDNDTLKILIQMNKIAFKKILIKYVCYNSINYEKTEKEIIDFIYNVTVENGLYLDSCEICPCKIKIQLILYYKNHCKYFILLENSDSENIISSNNNTIEDSNKKDNPFTHITEEIINSCNYNYIYFDLSDYTTGEFRNAFSIKNLYEYCIYLKLNTNSKIILNIKNEMNKTEEYKNLLSVIDICICYNKKNLYENLTILKYNEDKNEKNIREDIFYHFFDTINANRNREEPMKELKLKYNRIKSKFFIKNNESNDTKSIGSKSTSKTSLSLDNNNKIKLKKVKSLLPKILDKFDMFNYYI